MLPNHNSVLAEHISNLGPEKKLGQDTRWPTMVWELKKSQKTWNYYLLDRKMSKMPSLSRDTDITKFGRENEQKKILSLLIAFFNIRNSNHKHTCVEHIPNINFVFYPVKSDALPILQECPYNKMWSGSQGSKHFNLRIWSL